MNSGLVSIHLLLVEGAGCSVASTVGVRRPSDAEV